MFAMIGVLLHGETPSTHLLKHVLHVGLFAVARKDNIAAKQLRVGVKKIVVFSSLLGTILNFAT